MSAGPGSDYTRPPADDRSVGEMVIDVSERVTVFLDEVLG